LGIVSDHSPAEITPVELCWGAKVATRDGTLLNATIYLPGGPRPPGVCILAMTPYVADVYHAEGTYFAGHGLPFVVVDVRGRGNSEGTFRPGIQEAEDGFDLVEWLAAQPYCNGEVALFGGSYSAYAQWATAKEFPPHLATIVPIAATFYGLHVPMRNNVFYPERLRWLLLTQGHTHRGRLYADDAFWAGVCRSWRDSGRPFRELDSIAENPSALFQEWLSHPEPDAYWDEYNPSAADYSRLAIPILTITGCYDVDQPGALEHYKRHVASAAAEARARHFLIIGPWNHSAAQLPRAEFGGMRFGPESVIDIRKLHLEWYAWIARGAPRPKFLRRNVAYYVMGAEKWRYADTLAGVTSRHQPLFLTSNGTANDVFHSGALSAISANGPADRYTYDPRAPSALEDDADSRADAQLLLDQSLTLALRGRHLVYHSDPLERNTEISGFARLEAWISIDCPDTDLHVSLHEVCEDGVVLFLTSDVLRARYREDTRRPRLIGTSAPLHYTFDSFTFVSRELRRGHRLRLVIAPVGRIDMAFVQRNHNTGGVVADEARESGRPVTVSLFHDEAHPSALYVPLGQGDL
jgi:uncharacterized protein